MYPGVTISRSFGDLLAHDIGVISTPTIKHHVFDSQDLFVALGTEGLWANIESNELVELVNDYNT